MHHVETKGVLLGLRQNTRSKQAGSRDREIIKHSTDGHRQKRSQREHGLGINNERSNQTSKGQQLNTKKHKNRLNTITNNNKRRRGTKIINANNTPYKINTVNTTNMILKQRRQAGTRLGITMTTAGYGRVQEVLSKHK